MPQLWQENVNIIFIQIWDNFFLCHNSNNGTILQLCIKLNMVCTDIYLKLEDCDWRGVGSFCVQLCMVFIKLIAGNWQHKTVNYIQNFFSILTAYLIKIIWEHECEFLCIGYRSDILKCFQVLGWREVGLMVQYI